MKTIREEHLLSKEKKEEAWGKGEWVNEPDLVEFEYMGLDAQIRRIFIKEPSLENKSTEKNVQMFGGHLCGFVDIPRAHPLYSRYMKDREVIFDLEVHGGITFDEENDGILTIGFDLAHYLDIVPSIEKIHEINERYKKKLKELRIGMELVPAYRNIEYAKEQLKRLIEQIQGEIS